MASFEWDPVKDAENLSRHNVSFDEAQLAFLDPRRVIARDLTHCRTEERYYCFGRVGPRIMTVRFSYRGGVIRIIGAGYWRRGKKIYEAHS
jgi:uncharacterized protein